MTTSSSGSGGRPPTICIGVHRVVPRPSISACLTLLIVLLLMLAGVANAAPAGAIGDQTAFGASERDGVVMLRPALLMLAVTVAGGPISLDDLHNAVAAHPELQLDKQ